MRQLRLEIAQVIAGLHAGAKAIATLGAVAADQHRALHQRHFDLILILPHVELGASDPGLAVTCTDNERVIAVVADLEECLTLDQGDLALVLEIEVTQFAVQVQLDHAAVT
ncbi:hypothetical protein D3C76_1567890 [compost metagenome]